MDLENQALKIVYIISKEPTQIAEHKKTNNDDIKIHGINNL